MKISSKILICTVLTLVVMFLSSGELDAQCAMCRLSGESNLQNGGTEAKGLNKGILYLFSMPYILIGTIAFLWWKNKKEDVDALDA